MQIQPRLTVSGYRGIWGKSLNHDIVEDYTKAFIKFVKENINENPTILLARDGRESGPEIKETIIKMLFCLGIHYIDGDILPTPTVLFSVHEHKYDSAIIITASHNPREYNGLKFVTNKALFTSEEEVEKIKENYKQIIDNKKFSFNAFICKILPTNNIFDANLPTIKSSHLNFNHEHADQILKHIDVEKIRSHKFKVAVDMINASACILDPYLFKQLGVELIPINNIPDGKFAHTPEPIKENLTEIAQVVKENNCNVGFAQDPDADRLVVINEKGEILSEEYTLALGAEAILSKNPNNNIVVNMSTSRMSNDIAIKYGGKCIRTKVGEANVVAGIIDNNAIMGGEGGGAIIYPTMNTARDSFASLSVILELLAERKQTVSECVESLPKYEMQKVKIVFEGEMELLYTSLKKEFADANNVDTLDGIRFDWNDSSWLHVRCSNTEPKMWIISEAKDMQKIESLFERAKLIISKQKK